MNLVLWVVALRDQAVVDGVVVDVEAQVVKDQVFLLMRGSLFNL